MVPFEPFQNHKGSLLCCLLGAPSDGALLELLTHGLAQHPVRYAPLAPRPWIQGRFLLQQVLILCADLPDLRRAASGNPTGGREEPKRKRQRIHLSDEQDGAASPASDVPRRLTEPPSAQNPSAEPLW